MPYLTEDRRKFIEENRSKAFEAGDWNYLFTLALIHAFSKEPRYKTIHLLKQACYIDHYASPHILDVEVILKELNVSLADRQTARQLAFDEFYRRVTSKYEDKKRKENGDVYKDLLDQLKGEE